MEFVTLGCAGVGVDGDKGRSSGEAAEDFAGIDEKGFVGLGDFELMVVAKDDKGGAKIAATKERAGMLKSF